MHTFSRGVTLDPQYIKPRDIKQGFWKSLHDIDSVLNPAFKG